METTKREVANQNPNTLPHPTPPHDREKPQQPWEVPGLDPEGLKPCECCEPKPKPKDPCLKPPRSHDKDDCCAKILEILRGMPGGEGIRLHKPKQPVKVKVANLCCKLPVKDSVIPMLMLFLRRWVDGTAPINAFEQRVQKYLSGLPTKKVKALKIGLDAYDKIPPNIRECAFETRFDGADSPEMLNPEFLFKVWLDEALRLGRAVMYDKKDGQLGAGKVRPWEWFEPSTPDSKVSGAQTGPWPWICAVKFGAHNEDWFRNMDVLWPGRKPVSEFTPKMHEFSKTCKPFVPSAPKLDCDYERPVPMTNCHGNARYNYPDPSGTACLVIPHTFAGQDVTVRGINFCSPHCKAVLKRIGGGFQDLILECGVMGDDETPEMKDGKVVVSCEVRDLATFTIPKTVKSGLNDVDVPPGRYILQLIVPNDSNYAPSPGPAPKEFVSKNDVVFDIMPDPQLRYRYWTDAAFCVDETDGAGSDEPWFNAFTVHYNPSGKTFQTMFEQNTVTIMKKKDVDSGEWIPFGSADLFNGRFEIGGAFAAGIYGLEVDSESAAKEQIDNFGDAYLDFMGDFFAGLGGAGVSVIEAIIKYGAATASLVVTAIVILVTAIIGLFHAAWAPADPIALDAVVLDPVSLFDLTNPKTPLPASIVVQMDEDLTLYTNALEKKLLPGGTHARYKEERVYISASEHSVYKFFYNAERI